MVNSQEREKEKERGSSQHPIPGPRQFGPDPHGVHHSKRKIAVSPDWHSRAERQLPYDALFLSHMMQEQCII